MAEYDFDPAMIELGHRFLAVSGWTPPDGCGRMRGSTLNPEYAGAVLWVPSNREDWARGGSGVPVPDFRDPGTLGCLLALVRVVWGDPWARTTTCMDGRWRCVVREHAPLVGEGSARHAPEHRWFDAQNEAAALIAALEATRHLPRCACYRCAKYDGCPNPAQNEGFCLDCANGGPHKGFDQTRGLTRA